MNRFFTTIIALFILAGCTAQESSTPAPEEAMSIQEVQEAVVSILVFKDVSKKDEFDLNTFTPYAKHPFYSPKFDDKDFKNTGGGTGFIVRADGLVLTNKHVVGSGVGTKYAVIMEDGTEYSAKLKYSDSDNDIAVMQILDGGGDFPVAELGSSDVQIGQSVVAIGGSLSENSETNGVITDIGRDITAGSRNNPTNLKNLLQTDAAINPGNSGGPLIGIGGKVVGINTAYSIEDESVNFAIPIDDVKVVLDEVE